VRWNELIVGDVINVKSGFPFLLVMKEDHLWTWVNLSSGEAFKIQYLMNELEDPYDQSQAILRSRETP
jgi:hypothetical protein